MHPLKMLFDEINHDRWGIPSKGRQPTRRRQEPTPKFLVAMGDGVRKLPTHVASLFTRRSSAIEVFEADVPPAPLHLVLDARESVSSRTELDRAA